MVQYWVKDEEKKIKASRKGAKKVKHDRRAEHPDIKEQLHSELSQAPSSGIKGERMVVPAAREESTSDSRDVNKLNHTH